VKKNKLDAPRDMSGGFENRDEYLAHLRAAAKGGKLNRATRRALAKLARRDAATGKVPR